MSSKAKAKVDSAFSLKGKHTPERCRKNLNERICKCKLKKYFSVRQRGLKRSLSNVYSTRYKYQKDRLTNVNLIKQKRKYSQRLFEYRECLCHQKIKQKKDILKSPNDTKRNDENTEKET